MINSFMYSLPSQQGVFFFCVIPAEPFNGCRVCQATAHLSGRGGRCPPYAPTTIAIGIGITSIAIAIGIGIVIAIGIGIGIEIEIEIEIPWWAMLAGGTGNSLPVLRSNKRPMKPLLLWLTSLFMENLLAFGHLQ
jgi:hypothetical protein